MAVSNDRGQPLTDSSSISSACSKGLAGAFIFIYFPFSASFKYCCKYLSVTRQNKIKKRQKRLERGKNLKDLIYCFKYHSNLFTSRTIEHIGI